MKERIGIVEGLYIAPDKTSFVTTPQREVRVTFEGFAGDLHAGLTRRSDGRTPYYPRGTEIRNYRQVSLVSVEELEQVAAALGVPRLLPEWLGANLLIRGIPALTLLPPGTRLFFVGGAVLEVEGENAPCPNPGKVIQSHYPQKEGLVSQFVKAAYLKRGLVAWVERPGAIAAGGEVKALIPEQRPYPG